MWSVLFYNPFIYLFIYYLPLLCCDWCMCCILVQYNFKLRQGSSLKFAFCRRSCLGWTLRLERHQVLAGWRQLHYVYYVGAQG